MNRWQGLIAATLTPLRPDGQLALEQVRPLVDHLVADGVAGLYAVGSTGEGPLLTHSERRLVAEAFVEAAGDRVPVIVQVGHTSVHEAAELAAHAAEVGAAAVSAFAPLYFKPHDVETLVDCLGTIAGAAPQLPFYYYHIPAFTGVRLRMVELLKLSAERVPSMAGIKYTAQDLSEYQQCVEFDPERFQILWGSDEMLLGAVAMGAEAAVGSTYNWGAPLYLRLLEAWRTGNIAAARQAQSQAQQMIEPLLRLGVGPASKSIMRMLGLDLGPSRLPQRTLTAEQEQQLRQELERIGFFNWGR